MGLEGELIVVRWCGSKWGGCTMMGSWDGRVLFNSDLDRRMLDLTESPQFCEDCTKFGPLRMD